MKKILIALFIGFSAFVNAQNKISGKITDKDNNPIKGVNIFVSELHKSSETDENGTYSINSVTNGTIKITYTLLGFASQNKSLLVQNGENKLDIVLEPSLFQMDEVIVATSFHKLQSQNVMKVDHESIKSLQQKGAVTLIEGLETLPGISQISTGASIGKPVIRGLSGNRVLVYSQGVRLENQQFGDEHGLGLNDSGVESVEIIKGPASLLYGSDALGGVLYFNPEKFAKSNTFEGDFSQKIFSNTLGSITTLGSKASSENWKYLVRGSNSFHSDYKFADGNRVTNTRFNETDLKTGIGYSNSIFSGVFRYNFNKLDLGIAENGIAEQTTSSTPEYPKQAVTNHLLSLNSTLFFNKSKLEIDLGFISNNRSEFEDSEVANLKMKLNTLNYNLKYHLPKAGKLESIFGIQGMAQTNSNSSSGYLIPNANTKDFGVFGTANYEWNSCVLQAGIRFDNRTIATESFGILGEEGSFEGISKNYNSFNGSLGYKTNLSKEFILRVNVASGFRAPNLAELTSNGVHEGANRYEIGNSNLSTEQNIQTDLNLEFQNSHFEFFANGFYNKINNYIYLNPSPIIIAGYDVFNYFQTNAKLYGGEFGIHFHPHPLDWLHFESSFETVTGEKQNGEFLPFIPANNWNNSLRTEFNVKNWLKNGFATLNIFNTFDQKKVSGFETYSKGYTLVNIGIGGQINIWGKHFNFNINGNNLLNKSYIAHLSRLKNEGIPNIGRNVILGINFNI
jgi:iron complex outermembrane receptor protein